MIDIQKLFEKIKDFETTKSKRTFFADVIKTWKDYCNEMIDEVCKAEKGKFEDPDNDSDYFKEVEEKYRRKLKETKSNFCEKLSDKYLDLFNEGKISKNDFNVYLITIEALKNEHEIGNNDWV